MPKLTIFSTPKPFENPHISTIQRNAIRSWTLLPEAEVVLVGDEVGMTEVVAEFGVRHLPEVARNSWGTPLLSDIFAQARALADGQSLPEPPSLFEQRDVLREHFLLSQALYGPERCGIVMRKFGIKYAGLHPDYSDVRAEFVKVRDQQGWEVVLNRWYGEDRPGCYPVDDMHGSQDT